MVSPLLAAHMVNPCLAVSPNIRAFPHTAYGISQVYSPLSSGKYHGPRDRMCASIVALKEADSKARVNKFGNKNWAQLSFGSKTVGIVLRCNGILMCSINLKENF